MEPHSKLDSFALALQDHGHLQRVLTDTLLQVMLGIAGGCELHLSHECKSKPAARRLSTTLCSSALRWSEVRDRDCLTADEHLGVTVRGKAGSCGEGADRLAPQQGSYIGVSRSTLARLGSSTVISDKCSCA